MSEFLEFLEFCWNNKEDRRFFLTKKIKYGWTSYYISWELLSTPLNIHVDSRNQIIELTNGYNNSLTIEDPFIFIDLYNKCEIEYNNRIENSINNSINNFFNSLEKEDKDLSRIWKLNKMDFLDNDE
jgi:hypothetical protein